MQVGTARDHLPVIFPSQALHQRRSGSHNVGIGHAQTVDPFVQALVEEQGLVLAAMAILVAIGELDEATKRWISIPTAHFDLGGIELMVIMTRRGLDTKMLRVEGLNDDASGLFAASGTARHLRQQLKDRKSVV